MLSLYNMRKIIGLIILTFMVSFTGFGISTPDLAKDSKTNFEVPVMEAAAQIGSVEIVGVLKVPRVQALTNFSDTYFTKESLLITAEAKTAKTVHKPPVTITDGQTALTFADNKPDHNNLSKRARDGLTSK